MDTQTRAELLKKVKQSGADYAASFGDKDFPDPYWHEQRQKLWRELLRDNLGMTPRHDLEVMNDAVTVADAAVVLFDERFGKKQADPS